MGAPKMDESLAMHHYRQGANDGQIADMLGNVGRSGVQEWRRREGLPANKSRALYWLRPETFQAMLKERKTLEAVCDRLGVHYVTLAKWRHEQGL